MREKAEFSVLLNIPFEPSDRIWAETLYLAHGLGEQPSLENMKPVVIPLLEGIIDQDTADFVTGFILGRRYDSSRKNTTGFLTDPDLNPEEKFTLLCTMRLEEEGLVEKEAGGMLKKTVLEKITPEMTETREKQRKDDDKEIQSQIYPLPAAEMKRLFFEYYRSLDKNFQPVFLNLVKTESRFRGGWVVVSSASEKTAGNKTCYLIRGEDAFKWLRKEYS